LQQLPGSVKNARKEAPVSGRILTAEQQPYPYRGKELPREMMSKILKDMDMSVSEYLEHLQKS